MTAAAVRDDFLLYDPRAVREIVTPEGVPVRIRLAGGFERATSFLVDLVLIVLLLLAVIGTAIACGVFGSGEAGVTVLSVGFFFITNGYFAWFELIWQGRTPGKRWLGLRVIDAHGGQLRAEAILARNLVRNLEVTVPLLLFLNPEALFPGANTWVALGSLGWLLILALLPAFNRERLRVGDLVGGTRVIVVPKMTLLADLSARPAAQQTRAARECEFTDAQLGVYGVFELQVLEDVLRRAKDSLAGETMTVVAQRIQARIKWVAPARRVRPEVFLREFYAALRAHLEQRMLLGHKKRDKFSK